MPAYDSPASPTVPRRVKTDAKGVYYRIGATGKRRYEITWLEGQRRRWQTLDCGYEDAKDALRQVQSRKHKGETVGKPTRKTFADVAAEYLASPRFARLATTTRTTYAWSLGADNETMQALGSMQVATIDRRTLADFIYRVESRTKRNRTEGTPRRSTVENVLKPVRAVLRWAVDQGYIAVSPFVSLSQDERPRRDAEPHEAHRWTDDELERLLAASRARAATAAAARERAEEAPGYDYSLILTVAARAGLRMGECLGLDWEACHLVKGDGWIDVRHQWSRHKELVPPKSGSRRRVPIADELVQALLEAKMRAAVKAGPVFVTRQGNRLNYRNVEKRGFDAAARDAGIDGVTFHDLRHAYGSRLAWKGLGAREIADAMGHKRTATTETYVQMFNEPQAARRVRDAMSG